MLAVAEAQDRILEAARLQPPEQCALRQALGRVLAEDIAARRTQPPSAMSAMDGYAVRSDDVKTAPVTLKIVAEIPAGQSYDQILNPGETARIFTGAPLPAGADAIVIQENAERDGESVTLSASAESGTYVRPAGLDFSDGEVLLKAGKLLNARDIGLIAAMNIPWLMVRRRPRIAILATGDEVVMPGDPIGPNQIVSSNGLALAALIEAVGGEPVLLGVAPDDAAGLKQLAAGAKGADMLVTTGGASVGEHDLVQSALGEQGLALDFWRIAMRPGKPLMFGRIGDAQMLGLPGNPVSSIVCSILFLAPAIRTMLGQNDPGSDGDRFNAILARDLAENDRRQDYLRAALSTDADGAVQVDPFPKQDSSMMRLLQRSDCFVIRAPHAPALKAGVRVACLGFPGGVLRV